MTWTDNQQRYGRVSRLFHWGLALLLTWQFASAVARVLIEDTAVEQFLWSTHRPLGTLILLLIVLRVIWALTQRKHRPPAVHKLALTGHIVLYTLTFLVPLIALIRQYGSGRAFEPFGIPLFSGFEGDRIEWMLSLGGALHGELGWLLLVLTLGHVGMALFHQRSPNQLKVLPRMLGSNTSQR